MPVLIMRGQWDGIASFQDLANFFARLPNPDKQFVVMPGIAHTSTRSKNWGLVYHLLDAYFSPACAGVHRLIARSSTRRTSPRSTV